jgi:hypothetical protein
MYYGLAGEYRKPMYGEGFGVEYRVLSNFWLASPGLMQLTWDIGRMCVRLAHSKYGNLWAGNQDETVATINSGDYEQANKILRRNRPMFTWMLKQVYRRQESIAGAFDISDLGLQAVVRDPENFSENWHFNDIWEPNGLSPWARWEPWL